MLKTDTKPTQSVLRIRKSLKCRGSSVVERRPEKAGVASSILAPGTIHARTPGEPVGVIRHTAGSHNRELETLHTRRGALPTSILCFERCQPPIALMVATLPESSDFF